MFSSPVNYVERIAYNAKGQQLLVAYGNGIMTRFLYRTDNFRLLRLKSEKYTKSGLTYTSNSGVKQNYSYVYDLSGNIINISDTTTNCGYGTTPDALSRKFIYDALYRLLSATGRETAATGTTPWDDLYRPENESLARGYRQLYDYDKLGNIQSLQHIATSGNFTRSFDYGSFTKNALQKITISSNVYHFAYDVNGNMLSEGDTARHLEYDCADRLRCFYVQTGSAEPSKYTHYLYDGAGNRVKKITRKQGGKYTATTYIDGAFEYTKESTGFDGIPNLKIGTWKIGSYSSGGEQNILNIMGGATRRIGASLGDSTPAIKYTLSDHLGSSCVQLDTSGTTVSLEEYYPFGETSFGSYAKKRYRFCGKEKDEESGLYYYGMRYYSPWTCRFINVDPLAGKYPFYTPYQYAGNQPIIASDEDGLEPTPAAQNNGQAMNQATGSNGNSAFSPATEPSNSTTTKTNTSNANSLYVDPSTIKKANSTNVDKTLIRPASVYTPSTLTAESTSAQTKPIQTFEQAQTQKPATTTLTESFAGAIAGDLQGRIEDVKNQLTVEGYTNTLKENAIDLATLFAYSGTKQFIGLTTSTYEVASNVPNYTANDYAAGAGHVAYAMGEALLLKKIGTSLSSAKLPIFEGGNLSTTAKGAGSLVNLSEETFSQALFKGPEKIGGYSVYGTKGLVGSTFNRNIFLLEASEGKSLSGFRSFVGSIEAEALNAGANKISIYGSAVITKGFFNPNTATRFGYSVEQSGSGVFLQKKLK